MRDDKAGSPTSPHIYISFARRRSLLSAAQVEEEHAQQHQGQVHGLAAQVFLMESQRTEEKRNDDAAAPHHGHDGNHGILVAQGIKVGKVRRTEEERDAYDAPVPAELLNKILWAGGCRQESSAWAARRGAVLPGNLSCLLYMLCYNRPLS